jgi:hypothetical protein
MAGRHFDIRISREISKHFDILHGIIQSFEMAFRPDAVEDDACERYPAR